MEGKKRNFEGGEVESGPLKNCEDGRLERENDSGGTKTESNEEQEEP